MGNIPSKVSVKIYNPSGATTSELEIPSQGKYDIHMSYNFNKDTEDGLLYVLSVDL